MEEVPQRFFDHAAPDYDAEGDSDPLLRYSDSLKWSLIRRTLRLPDRPVLELGAGTGRWTLAVAELGFRVHALDVSPEMLEVARDKADKRGLAGLISFEVADMADLGHLATGSFPTVLCTGGALNYCADTYTRAVAEMSRVMDPAGVLYLDVDLRAAHLPELLRAGRLEAARMLMESGLFVEEWGGHGVVRHEFRADELLQLLRANGLRPRSVLGDSIVCGLLGLGDLISLVGRLGVEQVMSLEEDLSAHPELLAYAARLEVVCSAPTF